MIVCREGLERVVIMQRCQWNGLGGKVLMWLSGGGGVWVVLDTTKDSSHTAAVEQNDDCT